jgi:hypothetical protein
MLTFNSEHLITLIEVEHSVVLRLLVCDVVRQLVSTRADGAFCESHKAKSVVKNFPRAGKANAEWLSQTVNLLEQIDTARANTPRYDVCWYPGPLLTKPRHDCIFKLRYLGYDGNKYYESTSPFVAEVKSELTFLVPNGIGMLTLFNTPMPKDTQIIYNGSTAEVDTNVSIAYPAGQGDRFVNGVRSAIDNLSVNTFDASVAEKFAHALTKCRDGVKSNETALAPQTPKKMSIALIDLSSRSADEDTDYDNRANDVQTSEIGTSSPLREASLRMKQKEVVGPAAKSKLKTQPKVTISSDDEDMPSALRTSPNQRPLTERLRALQEGQGAAKSQAKSQLPQSSKTKRSAQANEEGTEEEHASPRLPDPARTTRQLRSKATSTTAAQHLSSPPTQSNQSKKRVKATVPVAVTANTSQLRSDGVKSAAAATMAQPTGLSANDDSQASNASTASGLKRRLMGKSTAPKPTQSQKPAKLASEEPSEFDFPVGSEENERPTKKAKTKAPVKDSRTKAASKQKSAVQVKSSPPRKPTQQSAKTKAKKALEKKTEATAVASRAKRAVKSAKYVESSDGEEGQESDEERPIEGESNEVEKANSAPTNGSRQEAAEDSFPLSKETAKAALKASQLEFMDNLEEMSSRRTTADEAPAPSKKVARMALVEAKANDNKDEEHETHDMPDQTHSKKAKKMQSTIEEMKGNSDTSGTAKGTSRLTDTKQRQDQASVTPVMKEKSMETSTVTNKVSKVATQKGAQSGRTPQPSPQRLGESAIPAISEKQNSKTKIVHFERTGPKNQAVELGSLSIGRDRIAVEVQDDEAMAEPEQPIEARAGSVRTYEPNDINTSKTLWSHVYLDPRDRHANPQEDEHGASEMLNDIVDNGMESEAHENADDVVHRDSKQKSPEIQETQPRAPVVEIEIEAGYTEQQDYQEGAPHGQDDRMTVEQDVKIDEQETKYIVPTGGTAANKSEIGNLVHADDDVQDEHVSRPEQVDEDGTVRPVEAEEVFDESAAADEESSTEPSSEKETSEYEDRDESQSFESTRTSVPQEGREIVTRPRRASVDNGDDQPRTQKQSKAAFRPQTPQLDDDDEPVRSTVRGRKASGSETAAVAEQRLSIGVSKIVDESYPSAGKTISTKKLRPAMASSKGKNSSAPTKTHAATPIQGSGLRVQQDAVEDAGAPKPDRLAPAASSQQEQIRPPMREVVAPSATTATKHGLNSGKVPSAKRVKTSLSVAAPSFHSSTITPAPKIALTKSMLPPPVSVKMTVRTASSRNMSRNSYPQSKKEEKQRSPNFAHDKVSQSARPAPVRLRKSLPVTIDEQSEAENDIAATPASVSTRLGLRVPIKDSEGQKNTRLGNESTTFVDNEASANSSGIYAKSRQHADSDDGMSEDTSPPDDRVGQKLAGMDIRETQHGLAAAMLKITNVSKSCLCFSNRTDSVADRPVSLRRPRRCHHSQSRRVQARWCSRC